MILALIHKKGYEQIKIKDIAELEFPDARSFVRPGFDDQESEEEI